VRIALLQVNPTAGDLKGNSSLILRAADASRPQAPDLAVTTELALMGYLPRDLLMNTGFVHRASETLAWMAAELRDGPPLLVGVATPNPSEMGRPLFNSAVLLKGGVVGPAFHKTLLPTYDVFDEDRYFEPAEGAQILDLNGHRLGISICEDAWNDRDFWKRRRYHRDPIEVLAQSGAELIVNLSASPFTVGKQLLREKMLGHMAGKYGLPMVIVNQVGGDDELIFDGRSAAFDASGRLFARAKGFEEDVLVVDIATRSSSISPDDFEPESEIWRALVLGVRDYARKTGFTKTLLGLSGGIDSALTAAIAVDAMGADNVLGVLMPSIYSSAGSVDDSVRLAANLGIRTLVLPISEIMKGYQQTLAGAFEGFAPAWLRKIFSRGSAAIF
jgi:NAD+ synthase (glutamine-hydrolysing)